MEQVPGMLWLAAVMGLLAACAFSFLSYLVLRRPRTMGAFAEEATLDASSAEDTASPEEDPAAGLVRTVAAEPSVETTPDGGTDLAPDEREGADAADIRLSAPADMHGQDADDAVMTAALAAINAARPDSPPSSSASPEGEDDWFAACNGTSEFEDFDPQEDDLVVVWDDTTGPEPSLLVKRCDDDPALTRVLMGDVIVAQVRSRANVDHEHVSLMPLSLARTLGWAHA